jgi:murein DD-endopeptidase MepM/ murein hydrolase activator NlpD
MRSLGTPARPSPAQKTKPAGACGELPRSNEKPSKSGWIWPVDGVVVFKYGEGGIDIAAPHGTPIWAARKGRVVVSGERDGYGKLVILAHDGDRVSIYAHNARNCVAEGTEVEAGDVVGLVGDSGGSASPKVHFEVRNGKKAVNPRGLLP